MPVPFRLAEFTRAARLFAIAGAAAIALSGCQTKPVAPPPVAPVVADTGTQPTKPLMENKPTFLNLPNIPGDHTPVRVGIILPFTSATPGVKALAAAMLKSAQLALYDSGNRDIILMTADEGTTPEASQAAAVRLLDQGAEILIGPLFATSVKAIAHEARDRGVPVLAFSTDKSVAGDGIFLLGFLPENDVKARHLLRRIAGAPQIRGAFGDDALWRSDDRYLQHGRHRSQRRSRRRRAFCLQRRCGDQAGPDRGQDRCGCDLHSAGRSGFARDFADFGRGRTQYKKVKLLGTGTVERPGQSGGADIVRGLVRRAVDGGRRRIPEQVQGGLWRGAAHRLAALSYDAISLVALLAKVSPMRGSRALR